MYKYTIHYKFEKTLPIKGIANSKAEIERTTLIQINHKKWNAVLEGKLVTVQNALISVNIKKNDNI